MTVGSEASEEYDINQSIFESNRLNDTSAMELTPRERKVLRVIHNFLQQEAPIKRINRPVRAPRQIPLPRLPSLFPFLQQVSSQEPIPLPLLWFFIGVLHSQHRLERLFAVRKLAGVTERHRTVGVERIVDRRERRVLWVCKV